MLQNDPPSWRSIRQIAMKRVFIAFFQSSVSKMNGPSTIVFRQGSNALRIAASFTTTFTFKKEKT